MYDKIFFTNVIRLLDDRNMNVNELHQLSGVSNSFLGDLTKGQGNPSIKIMQAIAEAFQVPLPMMIENVESQLWKQYYNGEIEAVIPQLPKGFEYVGAILPEEKAYRVKLWDKDARKQVKKLRSK